MSLPTIEKFTAGPIVVEPNKYSIRVYNSWPLDFRLTHLEVPDKDIGYLRAYLTEDDARLTSLDLGFMGSHEGGGLLATTPLIVKARLSKDKAIPKFCNISHYRRWSGLSISEITKSWPLRLRPPISELSEEVKSILSVLTLEVMPPPKLKDITDLKVGPWHFNENHPLQAGYLTRAYIVDTENKVRGEAWIEYQGKNVLWGCRLNDEVKGGSAIGYESKHRNAASVEEAKEAVQNLTAMLTTTGY